MARATMAAMAGVLASASAQTASASIAKQCPFTNICYSLNLPTAIMTEGRKDIFFQISGPDTYSWIGLGQGSQMEGANIFVIYSNGKGNVTLSPRLGKGMFELEYNDDAKIELLAGSGVSNGRMTANVKCSSCDTWVGGSMDFMSDSTMWIGAGLEGPALNSTDPKEHIEQHSVNAAFAWNMADARGGDGETNPFYTPQNHPAWNGVSTHMAVAHGALASTAFLVFLPLGAIFVRFARMPGLVYFHAANQILGYCVYVVAAALGIHMLLTYPPKYHRYDIYSDPHPKIGMALLAYLFFQPISGFVNHKLFGKKGRRLFSHYIHIWGGRAAILLGVINGGLGLRLGKVDYAGYRAAYGIVATVIGALFAASIIFAETHRDMANPSHLHRRQKGKQPVVGEGDGAEQGHVRMDSMGDRERLHAVSDGRLD